jgi:uncharacterized phage-associated protein
MPAPYSPVVLANTFIQKFGQDNHISHLKLQKLCYYAYGWWLAFRGTPLTTVPPQVWKLGPVFQPIYSAFASSRADAIKEMRSDNPFVPASVIPAEDTSEIQLIDWIWQRYGGYTGVELSDKTHEVGTPWHDAVKSRGYVVPRFLEMDQNAVGAYFRNVAKAEGYQVQ